MKPGIFLFFFIWVNQSSAQADLCTSVNKIIADAPAKFKNLRGALEFDDNGTKYYELQTLPEGWAYASYILEGKNISLLLNAANQDNEEEGKKRFAALSQELASCLSITGKEGKDSFENPEMIFETKAVNITLKLAPIDGKYNSTLQVLANK